MRISNKSEKEILVNGGKGLKNTLQTLKDNTKIGITTKDIDSLAKDLIHALGATPSFLGYKPEGVDRPYPAAVCISVNDEVVHGIPGSRVFCEGDIVSLDCALTYKGLIVDSAITFSVGECDEKLSKLIDVCRESLEDAVTFIKPGVTTKDIGEMIEKKLTLSGYSVPIELGGHGVGERVHEPPFIPNVGRMGTNEKLKVGQVIAVEPIAIYGNNSAITLQNDGYTYKSANEAIAVHWEHTILLEENSSIVLT